MTVSVGMIGTDESLLQALADCAEMKLAAFCHSDDRLTRNLVRHGKLERDAVYESPRALLDGNKAEALFLSLNEPALQADIAGAALEAGLPCCLGLPMAGDAAGTSALYALSMRTKVSLSCWNPDRCRPVLRYARKLVRTGKIGAVRHINVEYALRRALPDRGVWLIRPFLKPVNSYPPAMLASWAIDDVFFLTGLPYTRAAKQGAVQEVPEGSGSSFFTELGKSATAAFQPALFGTGADAARTIELYGSAGTMVVSLGQGRAKDSVRISTGERGKFDALKFDEAVLPPMPVYTVMDAFAEAMRTPADALATPAPEAALRDLAVTMDDAHRVQSVLDAVNASREAGDFADV